MNRKITYYICATVISENGLTEKYDKFCETEQEAHDEISRFREMSQREIPMTKKEEEKEIPF